MVLDLLFERPEVYFALVSVMVASIVLHELGHALAASWEGDPTPRALGRLTWKPWVHMGWLSILLVAVMGIGWGVTPVNPRNFRHRRWGDVVVSAAGPAVNLLLAAVAAVVVVLVVRERGGHAEAALRFWNLVLALNATLFLLNLIPLPPLDGFSVAGGVFDLGQTGEFLRAAHPFPLIAAILFVSHDDSPFHDVVIALARGLVSGAAAILPG